VQPSNPRLINLAAASPATCARSVRRCGLAPPAVSQPHAKRVESGSPASSRSGWHGLAGGSFRISRNGPKPLSDAVESTTQPPSRDAIRERIKAAPSGHAAMHDGSGSHPRNDDCRSQQQRRPSRAPRPRAGLSSDGLEPCALYAVEGFRVCREPLGFAAGVGQDEAVLQRYVGVDLVEAGHDLLGWLTGDLGPRGGDPLDQLLFDATGSTSSASRSATCLPAGCES
jgi:hypothetical protein